MAMSSNDKRDSVTFVWAIENLHCGWSGVIESPVILSNSLYNTAWKMVLKPIGNDNDDTWISLGLTRCDLEDNGTESIVLDFKLSIVDEEGSPLKWKKIEKHQFKRGHNWLCERFVEGVEVFTSRKFKYIPRDTLTVSCLLRRSFNEETESEVRFSRTRIEKLCFYWTIKDFYFTQSNKLPVKKTDSETPLIFELRVEKGEVEIDVTSTGYERLHFLCYTSLIDKFGKISKTQDNWYSYELSASDSVWVPKVTRLISFLNKGFLWSKKNLYLPMGVLSMHVECFFWTGNADSNNIQQIPTYQVIDETKIGKPLPSNPKVIEKVCETDSTCEYSADSSSHSRFMYDLQCMFEEGILSDFILRSNDKEFPVHKNILSARSPVFKAMFTTAMREKESNSIEIPDVNADTLEGMLRYVYLNRIDKDMQWESAMNLYFAADKYAIDELKRASCSLLKARLCVSNACEILVYADLHGDQDLKSTAKDFIVDNDSKVIGSDDWNNLLKSNINLAVEIFSDLYVKKMKN